MNDNWYFDMATSHSRPAMTISSILMTILGVVTMTPKLLKLVGILTFSVLILSVNSAHTDRMTGSNMNIKNCLYFFMGLYKESCPNGNAYNACYFIFAKGLFKKYFST